MLISFRCCDFECAGHPVWTLVGRTLSEWVIKMFERLPESKNRAVLQRFVSFRRHDNCLSVANSLACGYRNARVH